MKIKLLILGLCSLTAMAQNYPIVHPKVGETVTSSDGNMSITLVDKIQHYRSDRSGTLDPDIDSPKSANIHPDGTKFYINSLEGCKTMAYDMRTHRKLKTISHRFTEADSALFSKPSGLFPFRFYKERLNTFNGKPVEGAFSHGGRYLWVPFYRRTFDINAQEPSAMAIIDTRVDSTVLVMETGPLPKMVCASHDGKYILEQQARSRGLDIVFTDVRPGFVDTALLAGDFHYPMMLRPEKVAQEIVCAINHRQHIRVIDWRYRILTAVWRRIPRWIWRRIKLPCR